MLEKALVIIPTYNEIDNVEAMVRALLGPGNGLSVLIVDDSSPDGTGHLVKMLQKEFSTLHILERPGKQGLGRAYIAGMTWALERDFQAILEMDCDFSHDPLEVPRLVQAVQYADLVIGSRYVDGIRILNWPMHRLLLSYFASLYIRIITGMPIQDATGGFKCFSRKALESINLQKVFSNGYSFQIELNYKVWSQNLRVKEIPIIFSERREGQSKMSRKIIWEAVFSVFRLRFLRVINILH